MMGEVFVSTYPPPPVDRKEVLRYAGARADDTALLSLLDGCVCEAEGCLTYRVAYAEHPVSVTADGVSVGSLFIPSRDLAKNLSGCESVLLFGATVGLALDRLIARSATLSPLRALVLDALGSERVESLADVFCADMARKYGDAGKTLCPRFSPGYGDLPLAVQTEFFRMLPLSKSIGISLNESLLMTPRKSVTAFIGTRRDP